MTFKLCYPGDMVKRRTKRDLYRKRPNPKRALKRRKPNPKRDLYRKRPKKRDRYATAGQRRPAPRDLDTVPPCLYCGAAAGEPCRAPSGPRSEPHVVRPLSPRDAVKREALQVFFAQNVEASYDPEAIDAALDMAIDRILAEVR